jgi:hypothetical protein
MTPWIGRPPSERLRDIADDLDKAAAARVGSAGIQARLRRLALDVRRTEIAATEPKPRLVRALRRVVGLE